MAKKNSEVKRVGAVLRWRDLAQGMTNVNTPCTRLKSTTLSATLSNVPHYKCDGATSRSCRATSPVNLVCPAKSPALNKKSMSCPNYYIYEVLVISKLIVATIFSGEITVTELCS